MKTIVPRQQSIALEVKVTDVLSDANEELATAIDLLNATMHSRTASTNATLEAAHAELQTVLQAADDAFNAINEPASAVLHGEQAAARVALAVAQAIFDARVEAAAHAYNKAAGDARQIHQDTVGNATKRYAKIEKAARSALQQEKAARFKEFRETEHKIKVRLKRANITLERKRGPPLGTAANS